MLRRFWKQSGQNSPSAQVSHSAALEAIDALYKQETQANIAALRERRRRARVDHSLKASVEYWPVAVGIALSFFAPELRVLVEPFGQWGMWVVFPFVALAHRPEVYMGDYMAAMLPMAMLYLQFPLEGLLAKAILKGRVTPPRVILQVVYFHSLCILELWLVSGEFWRVLRW